jgi:hypothetical protein
MVGDNQGINNIFTLDSHHFGMVSTPRGENAFNYEGNRKTDSP